jgi:hypothetical protein
MQHVNNILDNLQFRLRDLEPPVERIDQLLPDTFGGHRFDVLEWGEQDMRLPSY